MLVSELIEKLENCNPAAKVLIFYEYGDIGSLFYENGGDSVKNVIESDIIVGIVVES